MGWESHCLCQYKERAGDNGRAGRRERRGLILTGFVGGAPCPAAKEGMGFWHGNAALLEGSKANSLQPTGPLKVMERKSVEGCADSDCVKPQQFLSLAEQVV